MGGVGEGWLFKFKRKPPEQASWNLSNYWEERRQKAVEFKVRYMMDKQPHGEQRGFRENEKRQVTVGEAEW